MNTSAWDEAATVLRAGGVVAVPTDTVWGLVTLPNNAAGVERIYAIKGRPEAMELPLLAPTGYSLTGLVQLPAAAELLAAAHWPGALTLIVRCVAPRTVMVIPQRGETLAVRVPGHPGLQTLMAQTGPLASTSANLHGRPAATSAEEVRAELGDTVDLVVDVPESGSREGRASTIVDCTDSALRIIRQGDVVVRIDCG